MSTASASEAAAPAWRRWLQHRVLGPLAALLGGGLAPVPLARALAIGALLGSMPLPWGTSLLCLGAALLLRLNPLAVQVGNYAAWPLQLLLAYPYLRLGGACFGPPAATTAAVSLPQRLATAGGAALGAWALTALPLLLLYYLAGRRLVAVLGKR